MIFSEQVGESDRLAIASMAIGRNGGALGITTAPGQPIDGARDGRDGRDLERDLRSLKRRGVHYLVTLLEEHEMAELHLADLFSHANAIDLHWFWLPITAGKAPDDRFLIPWTLLGPRFARDLMTGYRIVIHAHAGLGRAGTVASLLLRGAGVTRRADDAIAAVQGMCPGMIQTPTQQAFLRKWDRPPGKRRGTR